MRRSVFGLCSNAYVVSETWAAAALPPLYRQLHPGIQGRGTTGEQIALSEHIAQTIREGQKDSELAVQVGKAGPGRMKRDCSLTR